eukprot:7381494-Prymnesium_polylepis.5
MTVGRAPRATSGVAASLAADWPAAPCRPESAPAGRAACPPPRSLATRRRAHRSRPSSRAPRGRWRVAQSETMPAETWSAAPGSSAPCAGCSGGGAEAAAG